MHRPWRRASRMPTANPDDGNKSALMSTVHSVSPEYWKLERLKGAESWQKCIVIANYVLSKKSVECQV
jgi:myo-inositol catabolism protein IolC